jgi:signal transduction histidine kinase
MLKLRTLFFVFSIFLFETLLAQSTAIYTSSDKPYQVGKKASVFYDSTGHITERNILSVSRFYSAGNKFPVFDVKPGNIWIKVAFKNESRDSILFFNLPYSNISKFSVFQVINNNLQLKFEGGNSLPMKTKNVTPNYIIECKLNPGESGLYLFKISNLHPLLFPLLIESPRSLGTSLAFQNAMISIFLGIIIAIFFYNLFLYTSTKDASYLIYVIYLFFICLAQLTVSGYAFYLWPTHPELNRYAVTITSALGGTTAIIFAMTFLNIKKHFPKFHLSLFLYIGIYIIGIVLSLMGNNNLSYLILNFVPLFACITLMVMAADMSRKGYRSANFYLIAWITFLVGLIIFVLRNLNILPYNNFTTYILYAGSAIEVILLSIALADKINILKKEKEASQADALRISRENEQLVREQNIVLEKKVAERTAELQATNEQLSIAFKNLKGAQIQLVEAEKMASLGQLTAGIAHEINNPINFVKSNIKPLQLDFKDLVEVIDEYDKLHHLHNGQVEARLREIQSLKKSIDIDFVKDEILSLMKGIENGAERTAEIVRGLRTFSRLDESVIKTVNIHEGIDSTLILLRSNIPDNITVIKEYHADKEIECYPGKLNQVFMNILSNAIHAIKGKENMGADEKIIVTTNRLADNDLEIRFKDTGKGMSEEVKQKIYDPFFTTKDVGEGTGLGMAIVFKIIKDHSGKIEVISEEGKGCEFIITLKESIPGKPII